MPEQEASGVLEAAFLSQRPFRTVAAAANRWWSRGGPGRVLPPAARSCEPRGCATKSETPTVLYTLLQIGSWPDEQARAGG